MSSHTSATACSVSPPTTASVTASGSPTASGPALTTSRIRRSSRGPRKKASESPTDSGSDEEVESLSANGTSSTRRTRSSSNTPTSAVISQASSPAVGGGANTRRKSSKSNPSSRESSLPPKTECRLCCESFDAQSSLDLHYVTSHFKEKLSKHISSQDNTQCPHCPQSFSDYNALLVHVGVDHQMTESLVKEELATKTNGLHAVSGEEYEQVDVKEVLRTQPRASNFKEFQQQVASILRLKDGRHAVAVDERSIRCICGKVVRTCMKLYWKYLVQKPTVKNGHVIQKGHWFACGEVARGESYIRPWVVTSEELEASKVQEVKEQQLEVAESTIKNGSQKRRVQNKRVENKRSKRDEEYADSDEEFGDSDEESGEEIEEVSESKREDRFSMYRHISASLSTRIAGEVFLQDGPCYGMAHEIVMCHVCKYTPKPERERILKQGKFEEADSEISCCFYAFRKLKYSKAGNMIVVGYLDPQKDVKEGRCSTNDLDIWKPTIPSQPQPEDDVQKAKFILSLIGDQFCDMVLQEQKCLSINREQAENKIVVWKKAVKGVREMCDVCQTTLFNHHWTCGKCGIFVCLDCYKFRLGGLVKDQAPLEASYLDEYNWPLCTNLEEHKIEKLLLAQIIPKNAMVDLATKMHRVRTDCNLTQFCHRPGEFSSLCSGEGTQEFRVSLSNHRVVVVQGQREKQMLFEDRDAICIVNRLEP